MALPVVRATMLATALGRRSLPRLSANPKLLSRHLSLSKPRRKRPFFSKYPMDDEVQGPDRGGLMEAYTHSQKNFDEYLTKASLSPWVPVPDPVAKRMLEIAEAGPEDIHVELGSGDGRVNFHALSYPFNVKKSIGVDVDENLVGLAEDRLAKRHPKPDNLIFKVENLEESEAWLQDIEEATVITMYFVQDALRKLKPKLEAALKDRKCRIVCCGYAMPDWEPRWVEVILDLPIFMYTYNTPIDGMRSMTPAERAKLMAELEQNGGPPKQPKELGEDLFPKGEFDDVEEIIVPLWDPKEEIDGHWDDFGDKLKFRKW